MNKREYRIKKYRIRRRLENMGDWFGQCEYCGEKKFFYYKYDAVCCLKCDIWLESKCSDPECSYCAHRPEKPSEGIYYETMTNDVKHWRRNNYRHKKAGELKHKKRKLLITDFKESK